MSTVDLTATLTRAVMDAMGCEQRTARDCKRIGHLWFEGVCLWSESLADQLAPTVAALIEAAEKRGAHRALTEAADALDTIRHDHTKATLTRSAAGGVAPWLRRRAEEVGR